MEIPTPRSNPFGLRVPSLPRGFKPRDPRTRVHVPCRIQDGAHWMDGCIHNISARGLMIEATDPPRRGTEIDIRRGLLSIAGRVIWRRGSRFGVRARERIDAVRLLRDRGPFDLTRSREREQALQAERRIRGDRSARARARSAFGQFAALVGAVMAAAYLAGAMVYDALAAPAIAVARSLEGGDQT